jgi:GT2 family glycosyltransferase
MSNDLALENFQMAREHYLACRFKQARILMKLYQEAVNYNKFSKKDNRISSKYKISIIIVGYNSGTELLDCLKSVLIQKDDDIEIILIDNGKNENISSQLTNLPICWVRPPLNLLPSEGRNLGAHIAQSDILIFLDDDALMDPNYLENVRKRLLKNKNIAFRGRALPKSSILTNAPKHYNLGEIEQPGEFNLEGNMVIRRSHFLKIGGFDPLMFGHEGKALTKIWRSEYPDEKILYCPELIIRHDWAQGQNLVNKKIRQTLAQSYINYLETMELKQGISIIFFINENFNLIEEFLNILTEKYNCKQIEVLISSKDSKKALNLFKIYIPKLFIRIIPFAKLDSKEIEKRSHYDVISVIDLNKKNNRKIIENIKEEISKASNFDLEGICRLLEVFNIEAKKTSNTSTEPTKIIKEKKVFLIGERDGEFAGDNGFFFIKWIIKNAPEIDAYYLTDEPKKAAQFLTADRIIKRDSSQCETLIKTASAVFYTNQINDITQEDLIPPGVIKVFLRHGIAIYSAGKHLIRHFNNHDIICCMSFMEKKIIANEIASHHNILPEKAMSWLHLTGQARFDYYFNNNYNPFDGEFVYYSPTWRNNLKKATRDQFIASPYWSSIYNLITNLKLLECLQKHGVMLRVNLHFNVKHHLDKSLFESQFNNKYVQFEFDEDFIVHDYLRACKVLITDYSSVMWDVYCQNKPVILFQTDYEEFSSQRISLSNEKILDTGINITTNNDDCISCLDAALSNPSPTANTRGFLLNDACSTIYNLTLEKLQVNSKSFM